MYVRTYVCMYASMYLCMYVEMYVYMHVYMYVCLFVCIYICLYLHTSWLFHCHLSQSKPFLFSFGSFRFLLELKQQFPNLGRVCTLVTLPYTPQPYSNLFGTYNGCTRHQVLPLEHSQT